PPPGSKHWPESCRRKQKSPEHRYAGWCDESPSDSSFDQQYEHGFCVLCADGIHSCLTYPPQLFLLGFFQNYHLIGVTHTLALVRLRFTERTYLGGNLPNLLFVRTLQHDIGM